MDAECMVPFGEALKAYCNGNTTAEVLIHRDDGMEAPLPIKSFFREPSSFTHIEREALDRCRGRVLDAGAGTGLHTLELQRRRETVTSLDLCPQAVEVMIRRGVKEAIASDIFNFRTREFDTLLLLGHGVGMMETLAGLDRFLFYARTILSDRGRILLDSTDPAVTNDPRNLAYHTANRLAGKYIGEVRVRFEFQGKVGPPCGWLLLDPLTLRGHAALAGWSCSVIIQEASGDYLAELKKKEP